MTLLKNQQLNDDDLELLSAYIDNQLMAVERGALEERLRREPGLRTALEELRGTVAVLRELEPLRPPRSFTLDPVAFAPRPLRLFGWMRLGATLASVLLALTFAVDFIGRGGSLSSATAPAPVSAPQSSGGSASERSTLMIATEAPAAAAEPAAAAPTAAAAAAAAPAEAQPTAAAAPVAPAAPAAAAEPAPITAPEATAAPAAEPTRDRQAFPAVAPTTSAAQNSDTTITAPSALGAAVPTAAPAGQPAPPDMSTKAAPIEPAGGQAPAAQQPEAPAAQPAPPTAIRPLRLIEIGLGALALALGLGALWVRRQGR
jgi:hypothetical protein